LLLFSPPCKRICCSLPTCTMHRLHHLSFVYFRNFRRKRFVWICCPTASKICFDRMSESRQIAVLLQPEPQQLFRFPCVVPSLSIQLPCLPRSRATAKTLELLVFSDLGRLVSQLTSHTTSIFKLSFISGVAELLIFHPVDTIAKRLMSNKAKVRSIPALCSIILNHTMQVSFSTLSQIIFRDSATAPLGRKFFSLFPGLGYAAGYKVAQRVYKFGGQPWFNDLITKHYKTNFTNTFGERKGKMMMQASAGR